MAEKLSQIVVGTQCDPSQWRAILGRFISRRAHEPLVEASKKIGKGQLQQGDGALQKSTHGSCAVGRGKVHTEMRI